MSRLHYLSAPQRIAAVGLALRAGLKVSAADLAPQSELEHQNTALREQTEKGTTLELMRAEDFARLNTFETIDHILRMSSVYQPPEEPCARAMTAMTTADGAAIFTGVVGLAINDGFRSAPDSTQGWTIDRPVENFKTQQRTSIDVGKPNQIGRGGTADGVDVDASTAETYRVRRFGEQLKIDEQDLLDDMVAALTRIPREMGRACRELRPDVVCSLLMANAALSADSTALFDSASHANLGTGALSADNLGAGIAAIAAQRIKGRALNIEATHLIVPPGLKTTAQAVLRTLEHAGGKPLQLRVDDRLGAAGVVDPISGETYTGSATNWWLAADERTIEVGHIGQIGAEPRVREFVLKHGEWGLCIDVSHEVGGVPLDYRGLYKSTGAG